MVLLVAVLGLAACATAPPAGSAQPSDRPDPPDLPDGIEPVLARAHAADQFDGTAVVVRGGRVIRQHLVPERLIWVEAGDLARAP